MEKEQDSKNEIKVWEKKKDKNIDFVSLFGWEWQWKLFYIEVFQIKKINVQSRIVR